MYSVTIIDDDRAQRELLAAMVMRSPAAARLEFMDPAAAATDAAGPLSADIALVDIDLGEDLPSGIDLVRDTAANKTQVIYVTGYVDYASDVYETAHVGFLIKPVDQQRLNDALERAIARLDQDAAGDFVVHAGGSTLRVTPRRVAYIESNRRKLQIHEGERVIETYGKLSDVAQALPAGFARCHQSFLVNLSCVEAIRANELVLTDGTLLPVSQRCRKDLLRAFTLHVGREL